MKGRRFVPQGEAWDAAVEDWKTLPTDEGAEFDALVEVDCDQLEPYVSWGTNPGQVTKVTSRVPDPDEFEDPREAPDT